MRLTRVSINAKESL